jgi:hypothetical protein
VLAAVRDTAVAALASLQATEAVASGRLTRALAYSGFGEVDLVGAVARTATGVALGVIRGGGGGTPPPEHRRRELQLAELTLTSTERALAEARGALTEARGALAAAERQVAEASAAYERAVEAVEAARRLS